MEHHATCPRYPTCAARHPQIFAELAAASSRVPPLSGVGFLPWVGKDYGATKLPESLRILIVGESHYEWCEKCWTETIKRDPDLTAYCIAERMHRMGSLGLPQHWGKIENAFLGSAASLSERHQFWHSVTYYNFLQEVVGFGCRIPVERTAIWTDAHAPLLTVMEALQPDFVAVAGRRVWYQLPAAHGVQATLHVGGKTLERRSYRLRSGRHVVAGGIAHPARGLGATWRPVLLSAMTGLAG